MITNESNTPEGTGLAEGSGTTVSDAKNAFSSLMDSESAVTRGGRRIRDEQATGDDPTDAPLVIDEETEHRQERGAADQHEQEAQHESEESDALDALPDDLKQLRIKVKHGDRTEALTLDEIQKGYLRQADYTQKTQAVAQARQAADQHLQGLLQQRQQTDQVLNTAYSMLQAQMPQEPDWKALAQHQDPRVMMLARAEWDSHQSRLNQFAQAAQANQQAWVYEQQQLQQNRMASEFDRLIAASPELKDPNRRSAAKTRLSDYAFAKGFTPEELSAVVDHRMLLVLDDAAKYREAVARGNAGRGSVQPGNGQRPQPIRTATPGTQQSRAPNQSRSVKAIQQHQKRGTMDTAAAVFKDLL